MPPNDRAARRKEIATQRACSHPHDRAIEQLDRIRIRLEMRHRAVVDPPKVKLSSDYVTIVLHKKGQRTVKLATSSRRQVRLVYDPELVEICPGHKHLCRFTQPFMAGVPRIEAEVLYALVDCTVELNKVRRKLAQLRRDRGH